MKLKEIRIRITYDGHFLKHLTYLRQLTMFLGRIWMEGAFIC